MQGSHAPVNKNRLDTSVSPEVGCPWRHEFSDGREPRSPIRLMLEF